MSKLELELAAVAVAAVPELVLRGAVAWPQGSSGEFDAALVADEAQRRLVVRRARTAAGRHELRAEARAVAAISQGVRGRLPFAVPVLLALFDEGGLTASLAEYIPAVGADTLPLGADSPLAASLGAAIAAIHGLPRAFVEEAGLPRLSAAEVRQSAGTLVQRAHRTGRLPVSVERRWRDAVEDAQLWQFQPQVIHGSLGLRQVLSDGVAVRGVVGWSDLRVGDPARDVHWLQGLAPAVARSVHEAYTRASGQGVDRQLRRRAALYFELEIARWLLHGADSGDEAVIADAEAMLTALVDRVHQAEAEPLVHETLPVLDLIQVQALLREAGRPEQS